MDKDEQYIFMNKKYETALIGIKAHLFDVISNEEKKAMRIGLEMSREGIDDAKRAQLQELAIKQAEDMGRIITLSSKLADALVRLDSYTKTLRDLKKEKASTTELEKNVQATAAEVIVNMNESNASQEVKDAVKENVEIIAETVDVTIPQEAIAPVASTDEVVVAPMTQEVTTIAPVSENATVTTDPVTTVVEPKVEEAAPLVEVNNIETTPTVETTSTTETVATNAPSDALASVFAAVEAAGTTPIEKPETEENKTEDDIVLPENVEPADALASVFAAVEAAGTTPIDGPKTEENKTEETAPVTEVATPAVETPAVVETATPAPVATETVTTVAPVSENATVTTDPVTTVVEPKAEEVAAPAVDDAAQAAPLIPVVEETVATPAAPAVEVATPAVEETAAPLIPVAEEPVATPAAPAVEVVTPAVEETAAPLIPVAEEVKTEEVAAPVVDDVTQTEAAPLIPVVEETVATPAAPAVEVATPAVEEATTGPLIPIEAEPVTGEAVATPTEATAPATTVDNNDVVPLIPLPEEVTGTEEAKEEVAAMVAESATAPVVEAATPSDAVEVPAEAPTEEVKQEEKLTFTKTDKLNARALLTSAAQIEKLRKSLPTQEALLQTRLGNNASGDNLESQLMDNGLLPADVDTMKKQVEQLMEQANALYKDGKATEAQAMYDKISELNKVIQEKSNNSLSV